MSIATLIASRPRIVGATLKNFTTLIQFQPRQEVCDAYFRGRQLRTDEYLVAKIGFDTEENEPS